MMTSLMQIAMVMAVFHGSGYAYQGDGTWNGLPDRTWQHGFHGDTWDRGHGDGTWQEFEGEAWEAAGLRHLRHAPHRKEHRDPPSPPQAHILPDCPTSCVLHAINIHQVRTSFQDLLAEPDTSLIFFRLMFPGTNFSVMEERPYMHNALKASEWVWASDNGGRHLLGLPLDADVLSLYILDGGKKRLDVQVKALPDNCLVRQSPGCRLYAVRRLLVLNITRLERRSHRQDFVCHRILNDTNDSLWSRVIYQCCDTAEFITGNHICETFPKQHRNINKVILLIRIIAVIFTLFSPVMVLKIKMVLKYDNVTKFFRASLKHGITGQRNYVIRISSRQLINLSDPKPFSIPRFLFRLLFHCYGEGRCCIHWWGEWRHQPGICHKTSKCRRCWIYFWRFFAVALVYPAVFYIAAALYFPRLGLYASIVSLAEELQGIGPLLLDVNPIGWLLMPTYRGPATLWTLFSLAALIYVIILLSWPDNPLERCLLHSDTRRPFERPHLLYDRMTHGYRRILEKLAYGDFTTKTHFFRIRWLPWGFMRICNFVRRSLMQIPVINVCFSLNMFDHRIFGFKRGIERDEDETARQLACKVPKFTTMCRAFGAFLVWVAFAFILGGYCTAMFLMAQFVLNVAFFCILGAALHACAVLPWIALTGVLLFYLNDTLSLVNHDHQRILRLIDENSPRISAVEDTEEVFRDGTVQILKTHNLGAVKFIDGDNTEYVSKELYYNVCADLECGWSRSLRRVATRFGMLALFVLFVFFTLSSLATFTGSGITVTTAAVIASLIPKVIELYQARRPDKVDRSAIWAKIMPDILDRHIRVDRTACKDPTEEDLTTYDVRPVGLLELDVPRMVTQRSLRLWKFPWVVSADQQTQSHEGFIVALANKLAAAAFLSKLVTRAYSSDIRDETVLRQWCLLVENCILEGSATASSINGVPVEAVRLFPRDVQPLVQPFSTGSTIDTAVDSINRELYGPFTKGVLVTIGNTTLAMCKMDNIIFAFNSSCHGDQVTDLFGAVLIATDFNTQNLQTIIKFVVDPYAPDSVPVYSIVPIEGFVFRSANVMQLDVPVEI